DVPSRTRCRSPCDAPYPSPDQHRKADHRSSDFGKQVGRVFNWWGHTVAKLRWWVLAGALAVAVIGAGWGTGRVEQLASGGCDGPGSESAQAAREIGARLGNQGPDLVVLYSSPTATVDEPALRQPVTAGLAELRQRPEIATLADFYSSGASP